MKKSLFFFIVLAIMAFQVVQSFSQEPAHVATTQVKCDDATLNVYDDAIIITTQVTPKAGTTLLTDNVNSKANTEIEIGGEVWCTVTYTDTKKYNVSITGQDAIEFSNVTEARKYINLQLRAKLGIK